MAKRLPRCLQQTLLASEAPVRSRSLGCTLQSCHATGQHMLPRVCMLSASLTRSRWLSLLIVYNGYASAAGVQAARVAVPPLPQAVQLQQLPQGTAQSAACRVIISTRHAFPAYLLHAVGSLSIGLIPHATFSLCNSPAEHQHFVMQPACARHAAQQDAAAMPGTR